MSSPDDPTPESIFAGFLARLEAGEEASIDDLCSENPGQAEDLRRLWHRRQEVARLAARALPATRTIPFFARRPSEVRPQAQGVEPGRILGDFRLVAPIGQGGMGQVWEAEQASLGRRVAVKVVRPDRVTVRVQELFSREARAGGRLNHPGIATVYAHGEEDDIAWIAMEYVDGSWTLADFLEDVKRGGEVPAGYRRDVASLLAELADALSAAHRAGVVHRDLKPGNVLITPEERVKVVDFGLARLSDEAAISETGEFAGTMAYSSPEQVAARRAGIDHRTDIFSLGVIAYELLSLRRPFTGETNYEIAERVLTLQPPDLRRVDPAIERDLAIICAKAMEKSRRDRYATMAELAADLRRFLAGEPIHARPPSDVQRVARAIRRHPTRTAVGVTAAIAISVFVATRPPVASALPFAAARYTPTDLATSELGERSPTFWGNRYVLFERDESGGGQRGIHAVDLDAGATIRRLSPPAENCWAPAVSPDREWLAHETPVRGDATRSAIVLRRLGAPPLKTWPDEAYRIEPPEGSVRGVCWSATSRFAYTHVVGDSFALMLHEAGTSPERDVVVRVERNLAPPGEFQCSFSADGGELVIAEASAIRTVSLGDGFPDERTTLDCGDYRYPVRLREGSTLLARQPFGEASVRMYLMNEGRLSRMRILENWTVGEYSDLAISPDQSLLAWASSSKGTSMFVMADGPDGGNVAIPSSADPAHPTWTPDGNAIVYAAYTDAGYRLFVFDLETSLEATLEVDVGAIESSVDVLQLVQPAFSQNGRRLVFRAKGELTNGKCDASHWLVVTPWPLDDGAARLVPLGDRRVDFPHVDDSGERVVWTEGTIAMTGRLDGDRLTGEAELSGHTLGPVRISGDGEAIAAITFQGDPGTSAWSLGVIATDGTRVASVEPEGRSMYVVWIPGGTGLAYLHASADGVTVRSTDLAEVETKRDPFAGRIPLPHRDLAYDPRTNRVAYTVGDVENDDIRLLSPREREE